MSAPEYVKAALEKMFGGGECGISVEAARGLVRYRVEIGDIHLGAGPVREWRACHVAWQAFETVKRYCEKTRFEPHYFRRAERLFDGGNWRDGREWVISYRNHIENMQGKGARRDLCAIVKEVRKLRPALSGSAMAHRREGGWFCGAADAVLETPIFRGTRPVVEPIRGFHMCADMPSLEIAVNDSLGRAIGMIAPDVEASFTGTPPLGEILKMLAVDAEMGAA